MMELDGLGSVHVLGRLGFFSFCRAFGSELGEEDWTWTDGFSWFVCDTTTFF